MPLHLAFFRQHHFSVTLSYDGKSIHNRQRLNLDQKTGSEAVVRKKLNLLGAELEKLRRFQVRGTIQAKNMALAEEAVADAATKLPHAAMLSLAADDRPFAEAKADLDLMLQATAKTIDNLMQQQDYTKLKRMTAVWQFVAQLHHGTYRGLTCHAGVNYLSVSTSGEFFLCHRFTEDQRGKIGSLQTGLDPDAIAQVQKHRLTEHEPCRSCWMRGVCAGGCFHENMLAGDTAFAPDPKFCYLQDGLMSLAVKVYIALRQTAPEVIDTPTASWRTEGDLAGKTH